VSSNPRPLRVAHVITGLETGGAETLLVRLLERLDRREIDGTVISLTGEEPLGARVEALGVPVRALGIRPRPLPTEVVKVRRAIREAAPDLVQTWLLHANVLGGVAARLNGRTPIVWGVHITTVESSVFGPRAAIVKRAEKALSGNVPARIVACSESSLEVMRGHRYPDAKLELIPNGFDLERFHPDPRTGRSVRRELGLPEAAPVVGHVARFHPIKDHRTLLTAATLVAERVPGSQFVLCGTGVTEQNAELARWAAPLGDRVRMLGERRDVARLYRAFDVAVSSSSGEALPLAIGEAMASGVPVAATRCGDSAALVGDTGRVTPVSDPGALAGAIAELLEMPAPDRRSLGDAARLRIAESYDLDEMADRYSALWREVAGRRVA
jgi:glycosyltransferase involved in cell wall biosynthesis